MNFNSIRIKFCITLIYHAYAAHYYLKHMKCCKFRFPETFPKVPVNEVVLRGISAQTDAFNSRKM